MTTDVSTEDVRKRLRTVTYPGLSRDIVSFGFVEDIRVDKDRVSISLSPSTRREDAVETIVQNTRSTVKQLDGVKRVSVDVDTNGRASKASSPAGGGRVPRGSPGSPAAGSDPSERGPIEGVEHPIAVSSGKGGVGKSTVAVNLAAALEQSDRTVGLLDLDLYGPDVPMLLDLQGRPDLTDGDQIEPLTSDGLKVLSAGLMLREETEPMLWRGARVMKVMRQFLWGTQWGECDVLVIDLPPGTGDPQLSLVQDLPLSGGLVVTTPLDTSLVDAEKSLRALRAGEVPILGMIENMSTRSCPHCGESMDVFGEGQTETAADRLDVPFLGSLPFDPRIRGASNRGSPIAARDPDSPASEQFFTLASRVLDAVE